MASHYNVAHHWAHKTGPYMRGYNMFHEDGVIYSYGRHFPIARHVTVSGEDAVLFTTDSSSVSTAKHMSIVRSAIPHAVTVLNCPDINARTTGAHRRNVRYILDEAAELAGKAFRAHKYVRMEADRMASTVAHAEQYLNFFRMRPLKKQRALFDAAAGDVADLWVLLTESDDKSREKFLGKMARADMLRKQERVRDTLREYAYAGDVGEARSLIAAQPEDEQTELEKYLRDILAREQLRAAGEADLISRWRLGEQVGLGYSRYWDLVRVRDAYDGSRVVETSKSVRIPLDAARAFWAGIVRRVIKNGDRVDMWTVDLVNYDMEFVVIGCHRFRFSELASLAAELGLPVNGYLRKRSGDANSTD